MKVFGALVMGLLAGLLIICSWPFMLAAMVIIAPGHLLLAFAGQCVAFGKMLVPSAFAAKS
jgi:hypothetical protein